MWFVSMAVWWQKGGPQAHLSFLCHQCFLVEVGFGQALYRKFAAVLDGRTAGDPIIKFEPVQRDVAVLRVRRAVENLTDEVHDSIAACPKAPYDFELLRPKVALDIPRHRDKANDVALQRDTLSNEISSRQDVSHERRCSRGAPARASMVRSRELRSDGAWGSRKREMAGSE